MTDKHQAHASIFISYSWKDKPIVDLIDDDFKSIGIYVTRDIRDLKYRSDIKQYMKRIRLADYPLIAISDTFLKSRNCMFEMLELMKEQDYHNRVLPILVDESDIFSSKSKAEYLRYWNTEANHLRDILVKTDPIKAIPLIEDLRVTERISSEIVEFLATLSNMRLMSFREIKGNGYTELLEAIGYKGDHVKAELLQVSSLSVAERDLFLERLMLRYPDNPNVAFKRAYIELTEKEEKQKAALLWEEYLNKFGGSYETYNNLGLAMVGINAFDRAKTFYDMAVALEPNKFPTFHNLGVLYGVYYKNYPEAILYFEKAIGLGSTDATSYYNLACLLGTLTDKEEAAFKLYEKALELDPTLIVAYSDLMYLALIYLEDKAKALEYANKAIENNPDVARPYYNLAVLYENEYDDPIKAKENYRIAIAKEPRYLMAYFNLSTLEARKFHNDQRAIEILEDLLIVAPDDTSALFNLAILLLRSNDTRERAKQLYLTVIEREPESQTDTLDKLFGI